MNRGHVDEEAARKRYVAGDAGTFFAQRLLGDLDDDILTGLEHFGDELRTARRAGALVAAAVVTRTPAGATIEATVWAASGTSTTAAITTATTVTAAIAASAVASTTAIRALETGARIAAADACGIARSEFFARGAGTARRSGFTWEQNRILCSGRLRSLFSGRGEGFLLGVFVAVLVIVMLAFAQGRSVQSIVMGGVGFGVG
jgi:hypothetical protein